MNYRKIKTMSQDDIQRRSIGADYYQHLHDSNPAFQNNNWLLDELSILSSLGGKSFLEVGCGNGRFLREASNSWSEVVGLDWARSPFIDGVLQDCPNVSFVQADARDFRWERPFDVLASADFLEHLAPENLLVTVTNLHTTGRINFHKIACYDDGHSHLSIFPPEWWLRLFNEAASGAGYRLHSVTPRKGDTSKLVISLTNAPVVRPT